MRTRKTTTKVNIHLIGVALEKDYQRQKEKRKLFEKKKEELVSIILKQESYSLMDELILFKYKNVQERLIKSY